jgi:2'-5' RNA ligase
MDTSRTFVAIELGDAASSVLLRLIDKLQQQVSGVRWSHRDQLHITLKFLGEIDNRELPAVCDKLRQACAGLEPFTATLKGLGAFPKGKPPRVLWAAVDEGADPMQRLHAVLDEQLSDLGIPRESRAFTPHVTLGRVGRNGDPLAIQQALEATAGEAEIRFDVDEVLFLASLREHGKIAYHSVDRVELQ